MSAPDDDRIKAQEFYKGVAIHDQQTPQRVAKVKGEVDWVLGVAGDVLALMTWASDAAHSPESRLLAAALVEASHALAAEDRVSRPPIDKDLLKAHVAGLDSAVWRHPSRYGTLWDHGALPREVPLEDC